MKIRVPLLAVLVMLNLLVFHGTLGGMNRPALDSTSTAIAHQVSEMAGASVDHLTEHSPGHAYYYLAALCALALSSFVGLFFHGDRRQRRFIFPHDVRQRFRRKVSFGSSRPTPPLLQVFRL